MSAAPPSMRVALYWAPALDDGLRRAGDAWLGRDAETGAALRQPDVPGIEEATAAPRLYGFHATLRPPMRLATGWDDFMCSAAALAARTPAFELPPLAVDAVEGFLALRETRRCNELQALADACVHETNGHRLPPDEAELARRRGARLSDAQEAMLQLCGYPYVLDEWCFHMTLTRRLSAEEMLAFRVQAEAHFSAALRHRRAVTELCVFTQIDGRPFLIAERLALSR